MKKLILLSLLVLVVALAFAGPAQAVLIKNMTTDTVLFYDDFESYTIDPNGGADNDPDNGAEPGDWVTLESSDPDYCTVRNIDLPGDPVESQYLRWTKNASPAAQFDTAQTTAGDVIHAEFMFRADNQDQLATVQMSFYEGDANTFGLGGNGTYNPDLPAGTNFQITNLYLAGHPDYRDYVFSGVGGVDTYVENTWQKWEIDYEVGASTFTLSIDGEAASGNPIAVNNVSNSVNGFYFWDGGATPFSGFVDAVEVGPTPKNRGDVTEDLFVGADDLVRILTHWGENGPAVTWSDGDCAPYGDGITTGDQFVGADDYVEVLSNWGNNYAPAEPAPEPTTMLVMALGTILSLLKRRAYN